MSVQWRRRLREGGENCLTYLKRRQNRKGGANSVKGWLPKKDLKKNIMILGFILSGFSNVLARIKKTPVSIMLKSYFRLGIFSCPNLNLKNIIVRNMSKRLLWGRKWFIKSFTVFNKSNWRCSNPNLRIFSKTFVTK